MSRTYAAKRLLEHGPLTFGEFVTVTGWPSREASNVLRNLKRRGCVACVNHQRLTVWRLA
jgi:hypothetical protein